MDGSNFPPFLDLLDPLLLRMFDPIDFLILVGLRGKSQGSPLCQDENRSVDVEIRYASQQNLQCGCGPTGKSEPYGQAPTNQNGEAVG